MKDYKDFLRFTGRVALVHTLTYFFFGIIISNLFNYKELFDMTIINNYMRPYDSGWIVAGPFLQPIRGLIFAIALWPFKEFIFSKKNGWLLLWGLFVAFGILSPPAAAPASIEGVIYSRLPLWYHLLGLPEILLQTLTFSWVLFSWERKSPRFLRIFQALVVSCYAYIGYAVASILILLITNIRIDSGTIQIAPTMKENFEAGSGNNAIQFMFIVAFIVNGISIYFIKRMQEKAPISNWKIFFYLLAVDTLVPFFYQAILFGAFPAFHYSLLIGLFPSLIIWLNVRAKKKE